MKLYKNHFVPATTVFLCLALAACQQAAKWSETQVGSIELVTNPGGQTLGFSSASGVKIITVDGFGFKDLNKSSQLDPYEDWRLTASARARDLAERMSVEQIAGLMLYSGPPAPFREICLLRRFFARENKFSKAKYSRPT